MDSSDTILQTTCQWRGRLFEATPDSFVEVGFTPCLGSDDEDLQNELEGVKTLTLEDAKAMTDTQLQEFGLDEASLTKLLNGEDVTTGAQCLCPGCLDDLTEEDTLTPI